MGSALRSCWPSASWCRKGSLVKLARHRYRPRTHPSWTRMQRRGTHLNDEVLRGFADQTSRSLGDATAIRPIRYETSAGCRHTFTTCLACLSTTCLYKPFSVRLLRLASLTSLLLELLFGICAHVPSTLAPATCSALHVTHSRNSANTHWPCHTREQPRQEKE